VTYLHCKALRYNPLPRLGLILQHRGYPHKMVLDCYTIWSCSIHHHHMALNKFHWSTLPSHHQLSHDDQHRVYLTCKVLTSTTLGVTVSWFHQVIRSTCSRHTSSVAGLSTTTTSSCACTEFTPSTKHGYIMQD